jgi:pimeloyl-ACP methyl ester carboxylesterase
MASSIKDVVFIHGMYMNSTSWQPWIERASGRGLYCHAPSWPYHVGEPKDLRIQINSALGLLTFEDVIKYFKGFIDSFAERPILIGHSIGALLVQKLVSDGYAHAGISISSAPPQGIITLNPHFLNANFPHVNPLAGNKPVIMTRERFQYAFCNNMNSASSNEAFEKYVVPESRNVPRSTLTKQAKIDFRPPHAPLLFMTGDKDHLTPLSMVEKNFRAYKSSGSIADFKEFKDRSHFICNQAGWEEVADYAFDWLEQT